MNNIANFRLHVQNSNLILFDCEVAILLPNVVNNAAAYFSEALR